ncbi:hypothetical protein DM01DRAFT_1331918 [Hesseltinella vesiculosa]|uniref:N-alpha-acetyltransferase 40 n=1 Tax=Hesseltinella vesiculosa TaxID=101127 RepID=A0A1X2GTC6_9FUNG|nr:hypothetical protein DM01DRAFT_1331918 [Hesseltinella vesiculosa]
MPVSSTDKLSTINQEECLLRFMKQPLTYQNGDMDVVIDYYHAATIPPDLANWAFQLLKNNLYHLYTRSNLGWDEAAKMTDLQAPEARYLVARSAHDPSDLKGFLMFQMVLEETMDDDVMAEVAYCYELQLEEHARSRGLGEYLMQLLFQIGDFWCMDKVMLTVFKDNTGAIKFYTKKMGFALDEISPSACLSARMAKRFDYEILSRPCHPWSPLHPQRQATPNI